MPCTRLNASIFQDTQSLRQFFGEATHGKSMGLVVGRFFQGVGQGHHGLANEVAHFFYAHLLRPKVHVHRIALGLVPHGEGHGFGGLVDDVAVVRLDH